MKAPGHQMILASAGSGKTYALTNRYVGLLAAGAPPERIVALTFTRKAAGEFFDEILNKLARAAAEPDFATRLAGEIGAPGTGPADFRRLLRAVIDAMPRLRLGTLDGFFARVARNFPLELGLGGEFEILQEHAARMERGRVLRRMFARAGGLDDAQREFLEAFKRATFGAEEKRLGAQLDRFIDQHQEVFLAAPERELWGQAGRIWPAGCAWLGAAADPREAVRALRAWVATAAPGDKQRGRWEDFLAALAAWTPGVTPPRALLYVLEKAFAAWPELSAGHAVLEFDRKQQILDAAAGAALASLARSVVGAELGRRLEMTQGIHAVLRGYDWFYDEGVRRAGKLTFADVQRLLTPGEGGARRLSRAAADESRLFIDYRLDLETDHWLLDEFQDTSHGQWSVLRNLIDEVVQDPAGARSFFYVGDVKQSVFAWRGGDPRLFREIFNHYNDARPGTITEAHLVKSWRSGPAVIAMVNRVFGDAPAIAELFPGAAAEAWNGEWRAHEPARPGLGGQAALLHAEDATGPAQEKDELRFARALQLLQVIGPLERGLSCALLVQKNDTAARLADFLRREGGLPALAESDLHICTDNPLGSAWLALVKAAAHPGDTLAAEQLRMTPLGAILAAAGCGTPEALTRHVLGQIHVEGFERMYDSWWRRLEPGLAADDRFSRERARQFLAAAGLFDATGSREVAEFLLFMERHVVREADTAAVVRVMTVHKAKGLGFDLVILPDLEGTKLDSRREGLGVQRDADRAVEWVLDLPSRLFAAQDPVLAAHVRAAEADACYENLSWLYVAMTRAKQAMYLITKPPGKSVSRNFPRLLAATLGEADTAVRVGKLELSGAWAVGDADWHTRAAAPASRPTGWGEPGRLDPAAIRLSLRRPARRPSDETTGVRPAASMFALERNRGAAFGSAVHALFAGVEWAGPEEQAGFAEAWPAQGAAGEEALACLRAPDLAAVWARPADRAEVWRERVFEIVLEGVWYTGVFDRVIVTRDPAGRADRVWVIDFKTDRVRAGDEVGRISEQHAGQLELYRRVAGVLTGLATNRVKCALVMTATRRLVEVPLPA
jgi:ATP-dependent exoDNAse (exonuclease V) beta subunit